MYTILTPRCPKQPKMTTSKWLNRLRNFKEGKKDTSIERRNHIFEQLIHVLEVSDILNC